jgi:glutamate racemase
VGGLTVVKEIKKILPDASIIYFGDTARLPYGNKSQETIQKYSSEIVEFLKTKGCETIVIACNTASALAADHLREKYPDLKIYDVVSTGAEAAVEATKNKKAGVIGTTGTISSGVYKSKISDLDAEIEVHVQACPLFVHLVEENWINRPETRKIAKTYLRNLKLKRIDTLLLGCTHYPLLEKTISSVMGKRTRLVSSGKKMAQKLEREKVDCKKGSNSNALPARSRCSASGGRSDGGREDKYFVSDLTVHFETLAIGILGKKIKIEKMEI